jgi:hypothetical protein
MAYLVFSTAIFALENANYTGFSWFINPEFLTPTGLSPILIEVSFYHRDTEFAEKTESDKNLCKFAEKTLCSLCLCGDFQPKSKKEKLQTPKRLTPRQ